MNDDDDVAFRELREYAIGGNETNRGEQRLLTSCLNKS